MTFRVKVTDVKRFMVQDRKKTLRVTSQDIKERQVFFLFDTKTKILSFFSNFCNWNLISHIFTFLRLYKNKNDTFDQLIMLLMDSLHLRILHAISQ